MVLTRVNIMLMHVSWVTGKSRIRVHNHEMLEAMDGVIRPYLDTSGPSMYLSTCQIIMVNKCVLNNVAERMKTA